MIQKVFIQNIFSSEKYCPSFTAYFEDKRVWTVAWCSRIKVCLLNGIRTWCCSTCSSFWDISCEQLSTSTSEARHAVAELPGTNISRRHRPTLDCVEARDVLRFFRLLSSCHRTECFHNFFVFEYLNDPQLGTINGYICSFDNLFILSGFYFFYLLSTSYHYLISFFIFIVKQNIFICIDVVDNETIYNANPAFVIVFAIQVIGDSLTRFMLFTLATCCKMHSLHNRCIYSFKTSNCLLRFESGTILKWHIEIVNIDIVSGPNNKYNKNRFSYFIRSYILLFMFRYVWQKLQDI